MSIVVGFGPDTHSEAGVRFGAELARGTGEPLVLVCVVPNAFADRSMSDFAGVSAGFERAMQEAAQEALDSARAALPEDIDAEAVTRVGRSIPKVLTAEGIERSAQVLVVGSAVSGRLGRIGLGSTTDRLVHSSALPVALTPRGYTTGVDRVRRLVFAVGDADVGVRLADSVARLAGWLGVPITLVTFVIRPSASSGFGTFFDQGTYAQWDKQTRAGQAKIAEAVAQSTANRSAAHASANAAAPGAAAQGHDAPDADKGAEADVGAVTGTHVVAGERWSQALAAFDWHEGDVLVVGSSESVWSGVFLGSTATHIMRHTPVPMFLLPVPRR